MGTGSSSCTPARPWRRARWGSRSGTVPGGQSPAEARERARCSPAPAQSPLQPLGEPDSDSELLDQVLAECDADGPPQLPLAPRHFSAGPAGGGQGDQAQGGRQMLLTRATPALENNNFSNNLLLQKAEEKSKTSYDYYEEEMMAAIEQEYGR
ncbi:cystin-1 [Eublepharis macularius]|uniref:Cystin-1 n=1 Tax=Eublepharis macularius TaxID=481883 RepID=A0AA97KWR3_EUBMA|nr:cystin-1 [Eublepharis macularius]